MRIACFVGEFPSLSETFILNQITGLIDRGHDVDIYATQPSAPAKVHPCVDQYQLLNRTYYHPNIPEQKVPRIVQGMGLLLQNVLKKPQLFFRALNISRYGDSAASLRLFYRLIPLLNRPVSYDAIHCHFGDQGLMVSLLRDMGAIKGPLITRFYGYDLSGVIQQFGPQYYAPLFAQGDLFLPLSQAQKKLLIDYGCPPEKIEIQRLGINCEKFTFKPRDPAAAESIRLISVARLVDKKGIEYAIRAIATLIDRYPNIHYQVIGDGDLRPQLEALIQELGLENVVTLLGWRQQNEVIDLLNQADVLLAPSITAKNGDQEGTPTVIMEAMAMGMPILSSLHSGIPEVVEDGVSGYLVAERDIEGIATKIVQLISEPDSWRSMGAQGRQRIESDYNIDRLNDRLVSFSEHPIIVSNGHQ